MMDPLLAKVITTPLLMFGAAALIWARRQNNDFEYDAGAGIAFGTFIVLFMIWG